MKLTQSIKDAIVKAILSDIPEKSDEHLIVEMQTALVEAMSAPVQAVYATNPKALRHRWFDYTVGLSRSAHLAVGDADIAVLRPWETAAEERHELKTKLYAALKGINTRKQFIDTFPEFIKYAPPERGTCATLPVVANVVVDLVKAGWTQTVFKG